MTSKSALLAFLFISVWNISHGAMPPSSASGEEVFRLNCGAEGWDLADPRGDLWVKDENFADLTRWGFTGGTASDAQGSGVVISTALTDIPEVYRTHRWGDSSLSYRVDLPNGDYLVTLHFAETYWNSVGARVFDVALQGQVVLDDLDVFAQAGGKAIPWAQTFSVTVSDEHITVSFPQVLADNAFISGIEIKVQSVSDDDLLGFLQKKMFWYFWNEAGAGTGLISDKSSNWVDDDFSVASIATTGLGLSVLTVAAERGWVTRAEARQRIHTTLDFFRSMQINPSRSYHGLWYHFVNRASGNREYNSEVSTVDSALFILGALQAGEYFRNEDPAISQKADQLYRAMEWDWFTYRGGAIPFISMGWNPEAGGLTAPDRGSFIPAWWSMYAETVFVDLLALGSPTHPIEPRAWVEMRRHGSSSADGGVYEYLHFPALFVHQYHHLYYDLRNKQDGLGDYWEAAIRATRRDRTLCSTDSRYEPDIWGLTACDTQFNGYRVFGSLPDGTRDGTAAPTGPLASIAMTPVESIASARKMFFQYKHAIWGRHGFADSFSTSANERADYALGLDNGPIVLAIENYRSNLIRETFMRSSYAVAGLSRAGFVETGLAPRFFSSSEKNGNPARYAFDSDLTTRWESIWEDGQWLAVDYGKPTAMNHVRLKWETAHGKDYRIQTSNDNEVWSTVATVTDGDGGDDVVWFPRTTARLVRLYGDHRGGVEENLWGFSLFDMEVGDWGPTDLRAEVLDQNTVRWTWTDNADDETGYRFYGAETPQGPFNLLVELPPNTASYIESGLRPVVNYHRRLLAVGPEGESSPVEAASGLLSSPGNSLGSVKAYPNPFHPGRDPLFFVAQIPVGSTVRLFTVSGEQVRELPPADQAGISRWDGRNEHGNPVASGVYLVVIKENEQTKTIRVGVE
jgi:hypothetical protein